MRLADLQQQAQARLLRITAGLNAARCAARTDLPPGTKTLLLLSPDEPAFWPAFQQSPEYRDGNPDPMDRWSHRVITDWAETLGATALFPFGGAPYRPFIQWELASGRVHPSPVSMLVHPEAGLYLSFRGALALPHEAEVPPDCSHPCDNCTSKPCLATCPVDALTQAQYDVPRCRQFLRQPEGSDCMSKGCAARRACPYGKTYGRIPQHSAFHMSHFV